MCQDLLAIDCGHIGRIMTYCYVCRKADYQPHSVVGRSGGIVTGAGNNGFRHRGSGSGNGSGDAGEVFGRWDGVLAVRNRGSGNCNGSGDAEELLRGFGENYGISSRGSGSGNGSGDAGEV